MKLLMILLRKGTYDPLQPIQKTEGQFPRHAPLLRCP